MDFVDRILIDPVGVLKNRPWWQVALFILPWALLVAVLWAFFGGFPGKISPDYKELTKNDVLDDILVNSEKKVQDLRAQKTELHDRVKALEEGMSEDYREFEDLKKSLARETDHKDLTKRLYKNE